MFRINSLKFAVAVLGVAPLISFGSEPATQPAGNVSADVAVPQATDDGSPSPTTDVMPGPPPHDDGRPHRYGNPDGGSGPGGGGRGRLLQRLMQPLSQKDIADAMIYMKDKSPNRYAALNSLPDGERKKNLQELAARNYLNWMRQLSEDPELYSVILKRIGAEDEVFGLVSELKSDPPEKKDATNARLREEVGKLVELGLQERQLRLDRLEQTVKEQKQQLAEDSSRREALVEERLKMIQSEGVVPSSGGGPRGRH